MITTRDDVKAAIRETLDMFDVLKELPIDEYLDDIMRVIDDYTKDNFTKKDIKK